jgi:hypothetical protein
MTIPKKLLVAGILILGMQQAAHTYNAKEFSYETRQILSFVKILRQFHASNKEALKVAQWLEQQVCDPYDIVSGNDLIAVERIILNQELSRESQIIVLSQVMNNKRQLFCKITKTLIAAGVTLFLANGLAIGAHLLANEIQNSTLSNIFIENLQSDTSARNTYTINKTIKTS